MKRKSRKVGEACGYPIYQDLLTDTFYCPSFTTRKRAVLLKGFKTFSSVCKAVQREVDEMIERMMVF